MKLLITALLAALALPALALTIGDSRTLGLIDPNHPADPTTSAGLINTLLDQPLGTGPTPIGSNEFTRSSNDPAAGNYPDATTVGMASVAAGVLASGGTVDFGGPGAGYLYLLAKYDGPNYGSVVWYVGGLSGNQVIPLTADGYGLSNVYLFNPSSTPPPPPPPPPVGVPDGGSTAMLLGAGLLGVGTIRRKALLEQSLTSVKC